MAEILAQVLQPGSVGDQRSFCFNDLQDIGVPVRGYLQDQAIAGNRRLRGLDPGVDDHTRDE